MSSVLAYTIGLNLTVNQSAGNLKIQKRYCSNVEDMTDFFFGTVISGLSVNGENVRYSNECKINGCSLYEHPTMILKMTMQIFLIVSMSYKTNVLYKKLIHEYKYCTKELVEHIIFWSITCQRSKIYFENCDKLITCSIFASLLFYL